MKAYHVVLLCGLGLAIAPAAFANDLVNLQNRPLDKVEYFHARPQFGIEETAPIITDWRRPNQQTTYKIVIPPAPKSVNQEEVLVVPPSANSSSGLVPGRPLEHAGFTSNISPNTSRAYSLPKGDTVGQHVVGNLLKAAAPANPTAVHVAQKVPTGSAPNEVFSYPTVQLSASGLEQISTKSHVRAELLQKK